MSLLPFALLLSLGLLVLLAWSSHRSSKAIVAARPIPLPALAALIAGLAFLAAAVRLGVVLTIGLAHSRTPFEYTRTHAVFVYMICFVLPTVALLIYQCRTAGKRK